VPETPPCASQDDLLTFPSETDSDSAPVAIAAGDDVDGALIFAAEPVALVHTPVPPPSSSEVDALLEFASDTGRPKIAAPCQPLQPVYTAPQVEEPSAFDRLRPVIVRWVLPSAAAFTIGVMSVLVSLREQESISTHVENPAPEVARVVPDAASVPAPPASPSQPDPLFDPSIAPGVASSMGPRDLRTLPRVSVQRLVVPPPPLPRLDTRVAIQAPSRAPLATVATRSVGTRGEKVPSPAPSRPALPAVETLPLASLPLAARGRELPDAVLIAPPRVAAVAAEPAVLTSRDEEFAVRRALLSYETAYENLNVAATAEVWPNVDRQKLSRAFAMLKSQGLEFQSCSITVRDASATAYCRGTYQYVRKVGNPTPLLAEQQWVFKMRRAGSTWKIDDVSASQEAVLAAQRMRGQG
jgi:hypothetical protein